MYSAYQGFQSNLSSTIYYNGVYAQYKTLRRLILEDASQRGITQQSITLLARDTWDVYEGTGFKAVMVPNNDLNTIAAVARHYGAHYLLLPAKRPQLDKIYTGVTPDARFRFIATIPGSAMKIYWVSSGP